MSENPNRRQFLSTATMLGLSAPLWFAGARADAAEMVTVETENGKLRGARQDGAISFKGVPYAADTGGKNRFMAPQPVVSWTGVRDALTVGDLCPHFREGMSSFRVFKWYAQDGEYGENCCVLNLFTPDLNPNAKRPVMLWLHGGGFQNGGGGGPLLDGTNLAKNGDVVVVSINHRINTFGFANLGFLDPRFADAANAGQLDIVAALRWVKNNISAFGGDPNNVTVFGESGGGSKVTLLMGMPMAKGLFHRAINMSGVSALRLQDAASTEPYVLELLKTLGIDRREVGKLQQVPADALLKAWDKASKATGMTGAGPVIDGRNIPFLTMSPQGLPVHASVPLMIGNCDTEITLFLRRDMRNFNLTNEQVKARVMAVFGLDGTRAEAVMEAYRKAVPGRTPSDVLIAIGTDALFRADMLRAAEAKANAGQAPVYLYNFVYKMPADGGVWRTPHASEIAFVFGNTDKTTVLTGTGPEAAEASRRMQAAFVAFARTGNPNNGLIPQWPVFDTRTRATMTFDVKAQVVNDYHGGDRLANQGLRVTKNNGALYDYKD
jgi:para-nitrobenzyl esterase